MPGLKKRIPVIRLKNVSSGEEINDTLHSSVARATECGGKACLGSLMAMNGPRAMTGHMAMHPPAGPKDYSKSNEGQREPEKVLRLAREFIDSFYNSIGKFDTEDHTDRWAAIEADVMERGTYDLTGEELVYGAKLAWRNSQRCIGRIQWTRLQVFDARTVTTADGMFKAICNHIEYCTNKGNIRSAITVFPQRTDGKHDYRVWNQQLFGFAGYPQPDGSILGDPINVDFTQVCMELGWKGKGTAFDILPMVLSANGEDPEYFVIPEELVLMVNISHPQFEWFKELGLRWYALPAVAGMLFDCGGIQFPGSPFSGWYMVTEVGARDLCDPHRYNILAEVGRRMGLDTSTPSTLWKDRALVEVNVAVMHSYQSSGVTMMDHHAASESFMKHLENEMKSRGGCPSDWIWIVPPLSSSLTPVFHQEMALYHLSPSFEYQIPPWKSHVWQRGRNALGSPSSRRKLTFREIARAVRFSSMMYKQALLRRIKATILFASETGRSERFASKLTSLFAQAFNSQIYCMSDYNIADLKHESLVLVVTSTTGNGDPPESGEEFAKWLHAMKMGESLGRPESIKRLNSRTLVRSGSQGGEHREEKAVAVDALKPLCDVRFAVFALGSSSYPNFASFGVYVDNLLGELGGERILPLAYGDEMCGQDLSFAAWAPDVFKASCSTFDLGDALGVSESVSGEVLEVRLQPQDERDDLWKCLTESSGGRKVFPCQLLSKENLLPTNEQETMLLRMDTRGREEFGGYAPGDHLGIFPVNEEELVKRIVSRLQGLPPSDCPVRLQRLVEKFSANGLAKVWEDVETVGTATVEELLSRHLDICTPPTPGLLHFLSSSASDPQERERLLHLATDADAYEEWRHDGYPNLWEVLEEFGSASPDAARLLMELPSLKPRFYSISSSPLLHPKEIHITVALVTYVTKGGSGNLHRGVCSGYLSNCKPAAQIACFVRKAPRFHIPEDASAPIIMVGPGTGIAPFRSFWQHRHAQHLKNLLHSAKWEACGGMVLYSGCRYKTWKLYHLEAREMLAAGVLKGVHFAVSRETGTPKTYVQDLLKKNSSEVYETVVTRRGHMYVCGDCTMAEDVHRTVRDIIQTQGSLSLEEADAVMTSLQEENRYHEDIFGITLRTDAVHGRATTIQERSRLAIQNARRFDK